MPKPSPNAKTQVCGSDMSTGHNPQPLNPYTEEIILPAACLPAAKHCC